MARAILFSTVALGFEGVAADGSQCPLFDAEALDRDLSGSDLGRPEAATSDECCTLCEAVDGCQGFVFLDEICYLKGAISGTYSKTGVVSRLRSDLGAGCPGYEPAQEGKDLAGTLLEDWSASSSELCCAACAIQPECQGFAFAGERCYLKGAVEGMYDNEGVISRVKEGVLAEGSGDSEQPQCPDFEEPLTDTDMSGTMITSAESATEEGCCAMCDTTENCDGFVFFEGFCYLKGGFSGTFEQTGRITRIKANLAAGCSGFEASQQDTDLSGELLQDWAAPGPEACCAACSQMAECQGFAFSAGHCYLKGSVVGTYNHTGVLTRVKAGILAEGSGAPLQCSAAFAEEMADTDVAGELLAQSPGETVEACCPMCEGMAGCQGFAHFEGVCYLKGNFTGTFSKVGVVSRLRGDLGSGCPGFSREQGEPNTDLAGDLLESWSAMQPEACCAACARKEDCDGFAFLDERCYLKGNVEDTYAHEGCVTNVKIGVLDTDRRLSVLV